MGHKTDGTVLVRKWKSGRGFALRFLANGERHYLTLGSEHDGWTSEKAATELDNIMADVRRGIWVPPDRNKPKVVRSAADATPATQQTFYEFSGKRLAEREFEVSERMYEHEEWALRLHLWPYFANWRMADFDIEAIDDYRRYKVSQAEQRRTAITNGKPIIDDRGRILRPLAPTSINKTIDVLRSYLAVAVDYKLLVANPAEGRRRRLKVKGKRPVHLDSVAQIIALLDVAGQLDDSPRWQCTDRRAIVGTLVLAGPRAHELANLLWRDIDLANRRIYVGRSKTDAGLREIPMLALLHNELTAHRARSENTGPDDLVFATGTGGKRDKDNLRNRILKPLLSRADTVLLKLGEVPLPTGVTPHKLRHTFASVLVACGEDPSSVMAQIGHTDPRFTLRVYAHMMRRDPAERARLKAYVNAEPEVFASDDPRHSERRELVAA
jgi:integrase